MNEFEQMKNAISLYESNHIEEAVSILKKIENRDAFFYLGEIYWNHEVKEENVDQKALLYYSHAGEMGHPIVQLWLGNNYYLGLRSNVDYSKALYWYIKAASNGIVYAKYRLACMYAYGEGTDVDLNEAKILFAEAADAYFIEADFGLIRLKGNEVSLDDYKRVYDKYFVLKHSHEDVFLKFVKWVLEEANETKYIQTIIKELENKQITNLAEKNIILASYYLKLGKVENIKKAQSLLKEVSEINQLAKKKLRNLEKLHGTF